MLKHYVTIALRSIRRKGLLSFVQIFGLSLGITAFVLIAKYVHYEKDWDSFNENFSRIYRVQYFEKDNRQNVHTNTSPPLSSYLIQNITEVEQAITIDTERGKFFSSTPELTFVEDRGAYATSEIFSVFSFQLIAGNKNDALDRPNAIVLSESMANKYFPHDNAIGKTIFDREKNELIVTGIMADLPANSHLRANYIRSFTNQSKKYADSWDYQSYSNYALLKPGVDVKAVNKQIRNIYDQHIPLNKKHVFLHPLSQVHLKPDESGDLSSVVFFYSLIGILILLLAQVNFMNLSTSFSTTRFTEIGIRKTNGGSKASIKLQFLSETLIISVFAFCIGIVLAFLCMPFFNRVVNREIRLSLFGDEALILITLGVIMVSGLFAGSYPAFIASALNPIKVLKGQNLISTKKGMFSGIKAMVYVQFVLSTLLFGSSIWMFKQVNFLKNKELGFDKVDLLHCRIPENENIANYQVLRNTLINNPNIKNLAISGNTPLHHSWGRNVMYEGGPVDEYTNMRYNKAGYNFIGTYNLKIVEGRNFSRQHSMDNEKCLINETAAKHFGWERPVGKWIQEGKTKYEVIGVIRDFHQDDVHNTIDPYILLLHNENINTSNCFTFLISPGTAGKSKKEIKQQLAGFFPNSIFEVFDFEEDRDIKDIQIWTNVRNTFGFFTILAIIIAFVGIFGLVVFTTQKKIKEIGIRKVQGAKTGQMFMLTVNQFLILLLIAIVNTIPAFPLLQKFTPGAFKYQYTFWDILLVAIGTMTIVILSSGYQALKAARMNPVRALRYE